MAGPRTKRAPFEGECWSDDDGTTYELEHEGRPVRVRMLNDGRIGYSTKGTPMLLSKCELGPGVSPDAWQNVHLQPVGREEQ